MTDPNTKTKPIRVYCDGACKPNPGTGYIGVFCADPFFKCAMRIGSNCTSNIAECQAAIFALEECQRRGLVGVELLTDSDLVYSWTRGAYRWKSWTARKYVPTIRHLLKAVKGTIKWIPGTSNRADSLSKSLMLTPDDRELAAIKSGRDEFSKMRRSAVIEAVGNEAWGQITAKLDKDKYQVSAARWILRGLSVEKAIRKIQAEREIGNNIHKYRLEKED